MDLPANELSELGQAVEIKDGQEGWYELGQFGRYYTETILGLPRESRILYLDESGEQDGFGLGGLVEAKAGYGLLGLPFASAVTDSWVYFYEVPGIGLWRYDFASKSWLMD